MIKHPFWGSPFMETPISCGINKWWVIAIILEYVGYSEGMYSKVCGVSCMSEGGFHLESFGFALCISILQEGGFTLWVVIDGYYEDIRWAKIQSALHFGSCRFIPGFNWRVVTELLTMRSFHDDIMWVFQLPTDGGFPPIISSMILNLRSWNVMWTSMGVPISTSSSTVPMHWFDTWIIHMIISIWLAKIVTRHDDKMVETTSIYTLDMWFFT